MGNPSKKDEAYQKLRDAISYGQLKPGERLVEDRICEMFGVGRTPLREAFALLATEGYLQLSRNRGATVSKITVQELNETYEIIAIMEGYAVTKATKKLEKQDQRTLQSMQDELVQLLKRKDYRNWLDKNAQFHAFLTALGGNTVLCEFLSSWRRKAFRYRLTNIYTVDVFNQYMGDHEKILQAVFSGKAAKAGEMMKRHGFRVKEVVATFFEQHPEF